MEILLVTQDFPPEKGGIQTYCLELARQFLAQGHRVRIICPGKTVDAVPLAGLTDLVRVRVHSSWLFLPLLFRLPRYLREHPSITHVLFAQWQVALADPDGSGRGGRWKHRSYCLVHGRELLTSVLGPLAPALMRRAFRRLRGAFPNSRAVQGLLEERARPACALRLAHPGVDPGRFHPVDAAFLRDRYGLGDAPVVACVTRMVARKNLDALIRAMPAVARAVPGAVLVLGGRGPEKEGLEALAGSLSAEARVVFTGGIPEAELVAHFCLGDVFALPSRSDGGDIEGFGIVFLEAGACEVAVVGSLSGGIPDAVEDGVTGRLVPSDDRGRLVEALVALLSDRGRAKEMGRAARRRIEAGYTWPHTAAAILGEMERG